MRRLAILLVAMSALVVSCKHEPAPGESVAEVCHPDNDGREVSVSGYLVAPTLMIPCERSCALYVSADGKEPKGVFVHLPVGAGAHRRRGR
jgi:hypothetical protein